MNFLEYSRLHHQKEETCWIDVVNLREPREQRYPRAQALCESRGGRPGLPVANSPYGLCRRKATSVERTALPSPTTENVMPWLTDLRRQSGNFHVLPAVLLLLFPFHTRFCCCCVFWFGVCVCVRVCACMRAPCVCVCACVRVQWGLLLWEKGGGGRGLRKIKTAEKQQQTINQTRNASELITQGLKFQWISYSYNLSLLNYVDIIIKMSNNTFDAHTIL